jgi:hypothetical protein
MYHDYLVKARHQDLLRAAARDRLAAQARKARPARRRPVLARPARRVWRVCVLAAQAIHSH